MDSNRNVGTKEAAELLGVSPAKVRNLAKNGELKHSRSGRRYQFLTSDLSLFRDMTASPGNSNHPRQETAREHRKALLDQRFESYQSYGKLVTWMAAGGIAAPTAMANLVPFDQLCGLKYLFVSTSLFALCLCISIGATALGAKAYDVALFDHDAGTNTKGSWDQAVRVTILLSLFTLYAAVVVFLVFIVQNFVSMRNS